METKANHLAVGAFVLAVIAGFFAFVLWLGKSEIDREFDHYAVYFRGSVSGLTESSTVRYRGVPVGTVSEIRIDPDNSEQVRVLIEVDRGTPIKEDALASLEVRGITGLVDVQIGGGSKESPRLEPKKGQRHAVIASTPSTLETLFEDVPRALARFTYLVERGTLLLSDENLGAIHDTLQGVKTLTGTFAASSGDFEALTGDIAITAAEVRRTAERINVLVDELGARLPAMVDSATATLIAAEGAFDEVGASTATLTGEAQVALREIRAGADALAGASDELSELIAENRAALRDFSNEGLYELSRFLVEARVLVDNMTRITQRFESDPARFLFGDAQAGFEPE